MAVCEFCNSTDFICLVMYALLLDGTVRGCAVAVRGVEAVSLPSPCVDVLLVCAEGYTQVTGVMAMMMMVTGRVLLVCALCVLWCSAGGRCDAGVGVGAQQEGGKSPPESKGLEASSQGTQDLKGGAADAKENSPSLRTEEDDEDVDDDSEEGDDGDGGRENEEEEKVRGQSGQEGTVALDSDSTEKKLIGSEKQTELSIASTGSISPSGSRVLNVNLTQTEVEEKK
ncbi:mucin-associated surface protein (MASP) [Trypanosoma cruzi]|nr:mucin-associated surface protein (MASP) [Trypanosoma cruzi]